MDSEPARLVVLASGGGSNCQALIDACRSGELHAAVVAVITNNPEAGVLERAATAGIAAHVIEHRGADPVVRLDADRRLIALIAQCRPDLVVLAGWMRILGAEVGACFPIINLHPAKPGAFAGTRAIERAFAAFEQGEIVESGAMVHWVPDAGVDVGPVLVSDVVPLQAGDTLDSFAERVHEVEHRLIVSATALALAELKMAAG